MEIDLYEKSADLYESLQHKRPDYVGAEAAFTELAAKHLKGKGKIAVADFCCGTGTNLGLLARGAAISHVTFIDINRSFLDQAAKVWVGADTMEIIQSDILAADLKPVHDVVISMFAYHHVPDANKSRYVDQIKKALKPGGLLLLGEIYASDKKTVLAYYEHLLGSISPADRSTELERFLRQTAESDHFEYKVSRQFAHDQLKKAGFEMLEGKKIWPTDDAFDKEVGTFVEVWKRN